MALNFSKSLAAAASAGLLVGAVGCTKGPHAKAPHSGKPAAAAAGAKACCKAKNECKGKGGCKTAKNACAGQNDCKGQGGCNGHCPK